MTDLRTTPLRMAPDLRVRPWAGARLAAADRHIGEAWLAGPASRVAGGAADGRTLDELAAAMGTDLVGSRGLIHGRGGFPVLVKLIDAAEWLSIQVHPNDAQALAIEGEPGIGKSESWLVLDAGADAAILLGPAADVSPERVLAAIGTADLPDVLARVDVVPGDRIDVPAGTLHAIGPGVFVYEIQQPCDITYRCWDWGRTDRTVHTDKSRLVTDAAAFGWRQPAPRHRRAHPPPDHDARGQRGGGRGRRRGTPGAPRHRGVARVAGRVSRGRRRRCARGGRDRPVTLARLAARREPDPLTSRAIEWTNRAAGCSTCPGSRLAAEVDLDRCGVASGR